MEPFPARTRELDGRVGCREAAPVLVVPLEHLDRGVRVLVERGDVGLTVVVVVTDASGDDMRTLPPAGRVPGQLRRPERSVTVAVPDEQSDCVAALGVAVEGGHVELAVAIEVTDANRDEVVPLPACTGEGDGRTTERARRVPEPLEHLDRGVRVLVERDDVRVAVLVEVARTSRDDVKPLPASCVVPVQGRVVERTVTVAGEHEQRQSVATLRIAVEGLDVQLAVTVEVADANGCEVRTFERRLDVAHDGIGERTACLADPGEESDGGVVVAVEGGHVGLAVTVEVTRARHDDMGSVPASTGVPAQLRTSERSVTVAVPDEQSDCVAALGVAVEGGHVELAVTVEVPVELGVLLYTPVQVVHARLVFADVSAVGHTVYVGVRRWRHSRTTPRGHVLEVDEVVRPVRLTDVEPLPHGRAAVVVLADVDVRARDRFDICDVPGRSSVCAHLPDRNRAHRGSVVHEEAVPGRVVVPVLGIAEVPGVRNPVLPQPVGRVVGAVVSVGVHRVAPGLLPSVAGGRHAGEAGRLTVGTTRDVVGLGRPRHAHDTDSREGHGDEEHEETSERCGSVGRSQGSHPFRVRVWVLKVRVATCL